MKKKNVKPIELQARYAGKPKSKQSRHGPEPERLKIEGNWIDAVDTALKKKRPPEGWPK
jgi:hypothetical protein